jgi:hypothetical protein
MENKMTAVEWLSKQEFISSKTWKELIDEAKTMEKNQMLNFTRKAVRKILDEDRQNPFNLEEFYNETYGK